MDAESSTPTQGRLVPDTIVFGCTHMDSFSQLRPTVRGLYRRLVEQRLTEPPGAIAYLQQYCASCKAGAETAELQGTAQGAWFHMVRQPLTAHDWGCRDRVSLMLMFHLTLLNLSSDRLRENLLNTRQDFYFHVLNVFRHWCKVVAMGMNTEEDPQALERLLALIEEVYGRFVHQEVQTLVQLYHRQLSIPYWDMTQVWPATENELGFRFMDEVQRFRVGAHLIREYPADLTEAMDDLCDAASAWSAALLGPPQQGDMRASILRPEVAKSTSMSEGDMESLRDLIVTVNVETMRFKILLFHLYKMQRQLEHVDDPHQPRPWGAFLFTVFVAEDEAQVKGFLERLQALEERAMILLPLQARLREEWDRWVDFAKPFADLIRTEEEA
ncbi:hypothetical protein PG985_010515 [Apiospora marii]|uniref:Cullin N-terminal domain-containing protein n=1 Tax=Apiospora marii TaxID=335849 RepID=A0ABR1T1J0_9PEZI